MTRTETDGSNPHAITLEMAQREIKEERVEAIIATAYDKLTHSNYLDRPQAKPAFVTHDDEPTITENGRLSIGEIEGHPERLIESVLNAELVNFPGPIRITVSEAAHGDSGQSTEHTSAVVAQYQGFHILDAGLEAYGLSREWFGRVLAPYSRLPETSSVRHPDKFFPVVVAKYTSAQ